MGDGAAKVVTQALSSMDAMARDYKRAEAENRRRARSVRRQMAALMRSCQEAGLDIVLEHEDGSEVEIHTEREAQSDGTDPRTVSASS